MGITIAQSLQQAARQEGLQEGVLRGIRRLGGKRFGPPNEQQAAELNSVTDIDRLDRMLNQVNAVHSWDEVLLVV